MQLNTATEQLIHEIETTPEEYRAILLKMVLLFKEGFNLKSAENSFRQGWKEAMNEETNPIETLWEGIDAE